MVEFALVLPSFLFIVFGIIEFAMISNDKLGLVEGARAGARTASLGQSITSIQNAVQAASAAPITDAQKTSLIAVSKSTDGGTTWTTVTDMSTVTSGQLVKVQVNNWPHALVTGSFFNWLPGVSGTNLPLNAAMVMGRE